MEHHQPVILYHCVIMCKIRPSKIRTVGGKSYTVEYLYFLFICVLFTLYHCAYVFTILYIIRHCFVRHFGTSTNCLTHNCKLTVFIMKKIRIGPVL